MDQLHNPPALQFLEAGAHIGAGHVQRLGDVFRVQWLRRNKEQRMDLSDRAVDPPTGAHFAPMQDELLLNRTELHISYISVMSEITQHLSGCQTETCENRVIRERTPRLLLGPVGAFTRLTAVVLEPGILFRLPGAPPASAGPRNISQAYGQPAAGAWALNGRGKLTLPGDFAAGAGKATQSHPKATAKPTVRAAPLALILDCLKSPQGPRQH